jgi:hypothetical protein
MRGAVSLTTRLKDSSAIGERRACRKQFVTDQFHRSVAFDISLEVIL